MKRFALAALTIVFLFSGISMLWAEEKTKDEVIAIASDAVKAANFSLDDVNIVYDEGGKLWSERVGYLKGEDQSPNHGILRKGFLKNYKIVFFDFKEPLADIWVFVDKDNGEVFGVYRDKQ